MTAPGPAAEPGRLVAQALSAGDPTGWFEPLYAAAEEGAAVVPWDRGGAPHWLLTAWAERNALNGGGRRALVVGCGLGADAEYIAGRVHQAMTARGWALPPVLRVQVEESFGQSATVERRRDDEAPLR